MARWHTFDRLGPSQLVFPIGFDFPFDAASMVITNNTPATLFLSRNTTNPSSVNKDQTMPPRQVKSVNGWFANRLNVGSDGSAIGAVDSLTVEVSDEAGQQQAAAATVTPSYRSLQARFAPNTYDSWGYYAGSVVSGGSGYPPGLSNLMGGYGTFGTVVLLTPNYVAARPKLLELTSNGAALLWAGSVGAWSLALGSNAHRGYNPAFLGPADLNWVAAYLDCVVIVPNSFVTAGDSRLFVGWIDSTNGYNSGVDGITPAAQLPNNLIGVYWDVAVGAFWNAIAKLANVRTNVANVFAAATLTAVRIRLRWAPGSLQYSFNLGTFTELVPNTNVPTRPLIPAVLVTRVGAGGTTAGHESLFDYWDTN